MVGYRGMGEDIRGTGRLLTFSAAGVLIAFCVLAGVVIPVLGVLYWLVTAIF